jgi:23S rRNA (uridine2552-2'-O)-methyltransferase
MKKKGKKNIKNKWADSLTLQAKKENYPARSVYKLKEIQAKFKIIEKGDTVMDLGCSPGSWLIYASQCVGNKGFVFGIDLKQIDIKLPENTSSFVGDILDAPEQLTDFEKKGCDVVLSDMAPATTGRKDVDAARSFELCETALNFAIKSLKPNGNFVCKIFQGSEFKEFEKRVKSKFKLSKIFKPESCRKASKEIYILGINKT